ncbi:class I SAM-dependent methyltransferase [Burkholderia sp. NLJ2]|uniref:class I SAM-dependent methyltransferase n=1 Tax=Burkholderia sp. NLJ2 TaxID=3090699 RepID=UPI003C6C667E
MIDRTTMESAGGPYERLYVATPSLWRGHVGEMVEFFCENVRQPLKTGQIVANAIDLGGGEGDNAIYLAERGYRVHLVDLSPTAIMHFEKRLETVRDEVRDRLTCECGSVDALTLAGRYDVIVAYGLLHCFPTAGEANRVARACVSALTSGGYFIVSALTDGVPVDRHVHPELATCHLPSVSELRAWLRGLTDVKVEVDRFDETHGQGPSHRHEVFRGIFRAP